MKYLVFILIGFILAQTAEYGASMVVDKEQEKCYSLWPQGKHSEYQRCMENQKTLNLIADVVGFNFIYTGRQLLFGY